MEIAAACDLGGLGAKEGPKLAYAWVPPGVLPSLIPWLVLLGLLSLKPNRCLQAWGIWLPVFANLGIQAAARVMLSSIPGEVAEMICAVANSLGFAIAALWLVAQALEWKHRFLTFLATLFGLGMGGLVFALVGGGFPEESERPVIALGIGFAAFVVALSLTLTSLVGRGRYAPVRLTIWVVAWCGILTLVVLAPFFLVAVLSGPGSPSLSEFLAPVGIFSAICAATLLPFMFLSFFNNLYRERLKGLLHLGTKAAPPAGSVLATAMVPQPTIEL